MKNLESQTSLAFITDGTVVTENQFAEMRLKTLPRKVRLVVMRPSGWVIIQHVGGRLRVKQCTEYAFNTPIEDNAIEKVDYLCDAAMSRARLMLAEERNSPAAYRSWNYGEVAIDTSDRQTGEEVLRVLDGAIELLLHRAHRLIAALAGGFRLVPAQTDGDFMTNADI